ncbi:L,D-transpeptidase [Kiritimatiellota bacterium B12222]|nr:L,D-transpeptidase [Kiritimatiellota bacterium B12222]
MQSQIRIRNLETLQERYPQEPEIWAVDVDRQCIFRLRKQQKPDKAPVSTSRFGLGNVKGSLKTPLGPHRVCEIIGTDALLGQPFKSRVPFGAPLRQWTQGEGDAILTRILWLDGLLPDLNHHSKSRYIYIHGTHQEEKLGSPASQGCIRMGNETLARWTNDLQHHLPLVWIGHMTDI